MSRGYQLEGESWVSAMNVFDWQRVSATMSAGSEYMIVGVCDADCSDLDLYLKRLDGSDAQHDIQPDPMPILGPLTTDQSGDYELLVNMVACSVEPCSVAVALFARTP